MTAEERAERITAIIAEYECSLYRAEEILEDEEDDYVSKNIDRMYEKFDM